MSIKILKSQNNTKQDPNGFDGKSHFLNVPDLSGNYLVY